MSEPFLAEIRMVGFNFAPRGWALCDGQLLPINQNQALFSLLGTIYGGDGRTTFALPDLRGRTPIHRDNNYPLGQKSGQETHTLFTAEMPNHTHAVAASGANGTTEEPSAAVVLATSVGPGIYQAPAALTSMRPTVNVGGSQAHDNMQPYEVINFCIALQGLFPSRS